MDTSGGDDVMDRIVFATDGSYSAQKAVGMVNHLMQAWPGATLYVLYVTKPEGFDERENAAYELKRCTEIEQASRAEWFPNWSSQIVFKHLHGEPAIAISTFAKENDADVIVLGSHGRGDVDRLLVGSVSHGVLYCSRVPVLVVRD
jgi:nucleotide-binding universal stress UspA family protein